MVMLTLHVNFECRVMNTILAFFMLLGQLDGSEQKKFGIVNTTTPISTCMNVCIYLFVHLAARHTMADLKFEELVKREKTVIHPLAMSSADVRKVKGSNEPKVDQQKQEAFDTSLGRYPEDKAGEYNWEKKIATDHGLSLVFSEEPSRRTKDDTAITYPRTAIQTGSMTVDANKNPQHGSHYPRSVPWFNPTQDPPLGKVV